MNQPAKWRVARYSDSDHPDSAGTGPHGERRAGLVKWFPWLWTNTNSEPRGRSASPRGAAAHIGTILCSPFFGSSNVNDLEQNSRRTWNHPPARSTSAHFSASSSHGRIPVELATASHAANPGGQTAAATLRIRAIIASDGGSRRALPC